MNVIATIVATLTLALSGLIASPAAAGRGDFPHPPGGGVKCIQAPCPQLPAPVDRANFPHPGGGQVKCFKAPCPRIPGIVRG